MATSWEAAIATREHDLEKPNLQVFLHCRSSKARVPIREGGTATELIHDRDLAIPPFPKRLSNQMLTTLRFWPILNGFRGQPAVHTDRLLNILMRVSNLVAEFPKIKELDINPPLAVPDRAVALDARIVFDPTAVNGFVI